MKKDKIRSVIKEVLAKYSIKKAYLFGSFIKKNKYNDIDVMIEPPKGFSLLDLAGLEIELEEKLNIKAEVISKNGLSPYMKPYIEKEAVAL